MGIAGVQPRQLAPTMGTTGSGSTDSPAPSPTIANLTTLTRFDGSTSTIAIDSASSFDIDTNTKIYIDTTIDTAVGIAVPTIIDTNAKIDIDTAIDTTVGIAVLTIIDTISPETEVDIAGSAVIDTTSPSTADLTPAAIIIDPTLGTAGAISMVTGGFDMAFGLFNFHVDNDGVAKLISVSDWTPPAAAPSTSPVIGQSLDDHIAGAIEGGTKAENFDPISRVERLQRSTSIPNHCLLRRLRRVPLRGRRRFLISRDRWL
jgi:hypothetical protein